MSRPTPVYPSILEITPYIPGRSRVAHVDNPIKLSSNESPFGPSPKAITAMQEAAEGAHRYPETSAQTLREAIGAAHGLDAAQIVCGAGSDELIALLCAAYAGAGDEVLYSEYGFVMYPTSALRVGATPVVAPEPHLKTDVDALLSAVTERTKMVFVANPNNPTGSYVTADEMARLRAGLPEQVLLVVDAAYAEYVTEADYDAGGALVEAGENTVMLRTFSKIYGLGGLRLGWAYAPPAIAELLHRVRGPFNVSSLAQAAGIAAVGDQDFVAQAKAHNTEWRSWLEGELTPLGITAHPSVANFLLLDMETPERAKAAYTALKEQGILLRRMETYHLPACLRVTIGLEEEMRALVGALKEI